TKTCVPTGTRNSRSAPSAPCLRAPRPFCPRSASTQLRRWSADRSRRAGSATSDTSPPSPPSPPSGPPFGTNFSRRNGSPPSPPLPALTWIDARSLNIGGNGTQDLREPDARGGVERGDDPRLLLQRAPRDARERRERRQR